MQDTVQDLDQDKDEDDAPYWTDFVRPLTLLAMAVVPFTSLWDDVARHDAHHGKYGAFSRFLDFVGPVPVAATFAGIGLLLLISEITRRSGRKDTLA